MTVSIQCRKPGGTKIYKIILILLISFLLMAVSTVTLSELGWLKEEAEIQIQESQMGMSTHMALITAEDIRM